MSGRLPASKTGMPALRAAGSTPVLSVLAGLGKWPFPSPCHGEAQGFESPIPRTRLWQLDASGVSTTALRGFESFRARLLGSSAVERGSEKPGVRGSIPRLATLRGK